MPPGLVGVGGNWGSPKNNLAEPCVATIMRSVGRTMRRATPARAWQGGKDRDQRRPQ